MSKLTRVLVAIMNAFREAYATPVEHAPEKVAPPEARAIDVTVPPPDRRPPISPRELALYGDEDTPPAHYGSYEPCVYSIYVPHPRFYHKPDYTFRVHNVTKEALIAIGAGEEYKAFWQWTMETRIKHSIDENYVMYAICVVEERFVLEVAAFGQNPQQYYCTILNLPDDRFTLLDFACLLPEESQDEAKRALQYALDHPRAKKGKH